MWPYDPSLAAHFPCIVQRNEASSFSLWGDIDGCPRLLEGYDRNVPISLMSQGYHSFFT